MENLNKISTSDLEYELERRKKLEKLPKILDNPQTEELQKMAEDILLYAAKEGCYEKDIENYTFEALMTTFYGKDIFKYLNSITN